MKKGLTILALVSSLFLGNTKLHAQAGITRANTNYENLAYYDALSIYEKIANRGFLSPDLLKNLGNSYYFNGDYASAYKWYAKLYSNFPNEPLESEYDFRYAQTLKNVGDDLEADYYFDKFSKRNYNSSRAKLMQNQQKNQLEIQQNSNRYTLQDSKVNSKYSDYAGSFYNNQVLFTTARDTGNFTKRVFTWTGDPFTSIYVADISADGTLVNAKHFSKDIASKFNESSPVITKDGKTMYFTRNNYLKHRGYDANHVTLLKIYKAELVNGVWTNITELPFNSDQFSTAHPALNTKEDMLYFVSDRPGGYGEADLWRVAIHNDNTFGPVENLGPEINTDGRETFPFLDHNNELYFATDSRQGLGGLDIFVSKMDEKGIFCSPRNIGAPINSPADDFGYIIDSQTKRGFFSSNRKGGHGKDDIYSFVENQPLPIECVQNLKLLVVDSKTRNIITEADLTLYEMDYSPKAETFQMKNGSYQFNTDYECGESYRIKVEKPNYIVKEELVTIDDKTGITEVTIVLEQKVAPIKKNDDLFKVLNLKPIYFDFDKDNIRPDATIELAKIVEVMKEYPKMKIDVRSFTDSRGNDAYNMRLSERRAQSTAAWIVTQGISSSRVTYKGYGETQLINNCSNGVKCSDEEHAVNRRSEFIVTEI